MSLLHSVQTTAVSPTFILSHARRYCRSEKKEIITPDEEYERAQKAILDAVGTVEDKVQRLVAAEVETLFHEFERKNKDDRTKEVTMTKKAIRNAVQSGAHKVKKSVKDHEGKHVFPFEDHPYPYAYPQINNKGRPPMEHKDSRILHAIEAAEQAVLHAIEQEVDTLFHKADSNDHHDHDVKAKVKEGVKRAQDNVKADNQKYVYLWEENLCPAGKDGVVCSFPLRLTKICFPRIDHHPSGDENG
jgi:hypothetical protein